MRFCLDTPDRKEYYDDATSSNSPISHSPSHLTQEYLSHKYYDDSYHIITSSMESYAFNRKEYIIDTNEHSLNKIATNNSPTSLTTPSHVETIIAVIVTHNRIPTLLESLSAIISQTLSVDNIIVVDNAADPNLAQILAEHPFPITYIPSHHNLGGAGGFALGILTALSQGADWVWLADDDGKPADTSVLKTLYTSALTYNLGEISPLVVDNTNPEMLAFPLRQGLKWRKKISSINPRNGEILYGNASLFNGALFHASTLLDIGVPDTRYFIRGDEVEIHRRLARSHIPFGTNINARYLHPNGKNEFHPIMFHTAHAQYPDSHVKRFFTYRNRGLLLSQPGMSSLRFQEWVRFTWFFLLTKRDIRGYFDWRKMHKLGRREYLQRNFARQAARMRYRKRHVDRMRQERLHPLDAQISTSYPFLITDENLAEQLVFPTPLEDPPVGEPT